jgi:hypothetical protein
MPKYWICCQSINPDTHRRYPEHTSPKTQCIRKRWPSERKTKTTIEKKRTAGLIKCPLCPGPITGDDDASGAHFFCVCSTRNLNLRTPNTHTQKTLHYLLRLNQHQLWWGESEGSHTKKNRLPTFEMTEFVKRSKRWWRCGPQSLWVVCVFLFFLCAVAYFGVTCVQLSPVAFVFVA